MSPCHEHNVTRKSRCRYCPSASGICEHRNRRRRCRVCCPSGYLAHISSVRIRSALKHKNRKSCEYLGCSIEDYRKYIENKFTEEMTWENIQIDHVIPLRYDNPTEEEIIERLHYTNTAPMLSSDNMSKGNRYIGSYNPDFQSKIKRQKIMPVKI